MKIIPIYQTRILSLPAEILLEKLPSATKEELAVLIAVYAEPEFEAEQLAEKLDMTVNAFRRALDFWKDAGVIRIADEAEKAAKAVSPAVSKTPDAPKSRIEIHTAFPNYSAEQAADIIEKHKGFPELLDSCERIIGKLFNPTEVAVLIGMVDNLALPHDYILLLFSDAAERGKKSLRYIEKTALDFFDRDIVTYAALEEELKRQEEQASLEKFIRDLYGIGSRAFIKKEKEFLAAWSGKYGFSREMLRKAYEVTVSRTNEASMSYANAVLENWYASGYKTVEEVEAAEAERAKSRETAQTGSSFATDDFYEAALKRSYDTSE